MNLKNPLALLVSWITLALAPAQAVHAAETGASSQPAVAQGTVTGIVTNAATGRALEGARVVLQGTGRATFTDKEGAYRFFDVSAGRIVVTISYTGLDSMDLPIDVAAGSTSRRDAGLTANIYTLSKFVVAGEREGNALAITIQRQSTGVKNVVSTDAFGSLGANPADLLARLPGVQGETDGSAIRYVRIRGLDYNLNSITLDGNRVANAASAGSSREFQFTQIGADSIGRIEVIKSPTPDMDADSIGGAVNMVSKSALDSKGRRLGGQLGAIYRIQPGFGQPPKRAYAVSYSEVFGEKFGVSFNYGNRSHYSPTPATSRAYENKLADPAFTYRFGTEDYYHKQTRWGGGLKLDYKLSENTRFYGNITRNRMMEPSFNHYIDYATAEGVATVDAAGNLTGSGGVVPGYTKTMTEWRPIAASTVTANSSFEWKHVEGIHGEIGAVHKFKGLDVDYNVYRSVSTTNYPHNDQTNIIARGIGLRIEDTSDPNFPTLTQTAGPDIKNPNSYSTARRDLRIAQGKDAFVGGAVNLKQSFETVVPTWIKAGLRARKQNRDLFANQYRWDYVGRDGVTGLNSATGLNDDNLAQFVNPDIRRWGGLGKYPLLPVLNWATWGWNPGGSYKPGPSLETAVRDNPSLFVEDVDLRTRTALANRMKFEESINAAYIMGNIELGKLQVTGGLRVEQTKTNGEGAKNEVTPAEVALRAAFVGPLTPAEIIRRTTAQYSGRQRAKGEYRQVFPGLHLKYAMANGLLIRASYATNIGRPSVGQLIPNTTVDNINRNLVISNPSLKPQTANNFDVGVEYYFEPVGVFSAGVFLKEIKQFIFTRSGDIIQDQGGDYGQYLGYTYTSQLNGGSARVRGFELAYQQQFTFLPGIWKGFGVYANYSRNETQADYVGTVATTKVAGFIPETGNAGISYIRFPLTIRFQYNYVGRRLVSVSSSQARLQYRMATGISDIKTVYEINKNFSFYLDMWNIFDEQELAQEFEGGRRGRNFRTGPQLLGGINWRY